MIERQRNTPLLVAIGRGLVALLLGAAVRLLRATWRVRMIGVPRDRSAARLLALWHGDQLALTCLPRPLTALVSRSGDGELASRVLGLLGFGVVRGSSSRGAVAGALALVRRLRRGQAVAVAVDGPRGPRHHATDQVLRVARQASVEVVPVAAAAHRRWELSSWDRFAIPAPFTKVYLVWGDAVVSGVETALDRVWREARSLAGTRGSDRGR